MPGRKRKTAPAHAVTAEAVSPPPASSSSRRRSTRISTSATEKSKYFEAEISDSDSDIKPRRKTSASSKKANNAKPARSSKKAKLEIEDSDNYDEDEEAPAQKEEISDSEEDEDAPPKVTFIPLPKLRDTGGIDYADDRLHPNTLAFLKDLKANNIRSWLKTHDKEFRRSLKDWESYVMTMTDKVIEVDETIPELPFKDVNFRIYRDIRFSNDPTPYKPNYGAAWSRTGRKGPYACYYLHLEPGGKCFVGGGLWHPPADSIAKIRASIDERPRRWRRVLMDPEFRAMFLTSSTPAAGKSAKSSKAATKGKGKVSAAASTPSITGKNLTGRGRRGRPRKSTIPDSDPDAEPEDDELAEDENGAEINGTSGKEEDDEKAVIKAFAEHNKENALKKKPNGYIAEHRDIELLKLRNFTVGKKIPDDIFTKDPREGQEEIARIFKAMVGFVTHLNRIVMPDPGDDDEESDEEE